MLAHGDPRKEVFLLANVSHSGTGVKNYLKAKVDIYFAEGIARCATCPMLETYARKQCRRTGEYIVDDRFQGKWCPLDLQLPEPAEDDDAELRRALFQAVEYIQDLCDKHPDLKKLLK